MSPILKALASTSGILLLSIALITSCSPQESSTTPLETPSSANLSPSSYLPEVPRISVEEVKAKLDAGSNIVIIDSRSENAYNESHIVGAISMPLADMAEPYSNLDRYEEIITYCT